MPNFGPPSEGLGRAFGSKFGLSTALELPQPSVSRHLAYLREAGLVRDRKQGLWGYYSLAPAEGDFHQSRLRCLECCFREVPELQADALRAAGLRESGGCCPEEEKKK